MFVPFMKGMPKFRVTKKVLDLVVGSSNASACVSSIRPWGLCLQSLSILCQMDPL